MEEGVISRATALRVKDIVQRVFAYRYLKNGATPAQHLKLLLEQNIRPPVLQHTLLIHTARAHPVLHDFICEVYWAKYAAGATHITRQDALDFLVRATDMGIIEPPWSETMMLRVARYLTGCLTDFLLAGNDQAGRRLDFISQEMLREANTIASKASDTEITRYVVDIKCQIDRIKEQVQNIE